MTFRGSIFAEPVEGSLGEDVADPCKKRARHRGAQIFGDLTRRSLCCLQGDIAGKALGDDDIDGAAADIIAFDEAVIFDSLDVGLTDEAPGLLNLFLTLDLLHADVQKADGRTLDLEECPAIAPPIRAKSMSCCASAPIVAPTSRTMLSPFSVGQMAAIAGR